MAELRTESTRCRGLTKIHLLGELHVSACGVRQLIPEGSKRLLAFMVLRKGRLGRRYVAGLLWPDGDDTRAAGNLRSALWRLRCAGIDIIESDKSSLWLTDDVAVDVDDIVRWADRVLGGSPLDHDYHDIADKLWALDILPGFYDDWAAAARERIRQRILHALEQASRLLTQQRRYADAIEAASATVYSEPLRESAQRTLIEAHLAEGNLVEARRVFIAYERLIVEELGVDPSPELLSLVRLPMVRSA